MRDVVGEIKGGPNVINLLRDGSGLSRLVDRARKTISEPVLGDRDELANVVSIVKERKRQEISDRFAVQHSNIDVETLWLLIKEAKMKPVPALAALEPGCKRQFINLTAWCYAKEGTQAKGRFSIDRLWRSAECTREEIEACIESIPFVAPCGVCGKQAIGVIRCGPLDNVTRPTKLSCPACRHHEIVGRLQYSNDERNFEPRFSCACDYCVNLRRSVREDLAGGFDKALANTMREIWEASKEVDPMALQQSRSNKFNDFAERHDLVAEGLRAGKSLAAALSEANPTERSWSPKTLEQSNLEYGLRSGWLEILQSEYVPWERGGKALARESVDEAFQHYSPSGSLARFEQDCKEGTDEALRRVLLTHMPWHFMATLNLQVRFIEHVGTHGPASLAPESLDDDHDHDDEPFEEPIDLGFASAVHLMRMCAAQIDADFGPGTAKRQPALVAALMDAAKRKT